MAAPVVPLPFWHGFNWEPLPFAEWTVWEDFNEDGVTHKSLNETIREQRDKLNKLGGKYIPFLLGLRNNIKRLISERLAAPHQRVFRVHYERLVREIETRIQELEARKDLAEFEGNIQPYILAHAAVISTKDKVEPNPSDKLIRRVLSIIDHETVKGKGSSSTTTSTSTPAPSRQVRTEDLVRDMISRLWLPHQAPSRKTTDSHDLCHGCNIPMTKSIRDQMLICAKCGFSMHYLDSTEAARTYGDDVEFTVNASHRYNHWQEYVTRSQGKELKAVPRSVLLKIVSDLNKIEEITQSEQITMDHILRSTTRLGLREYKKNVVQIFCRLTGNWPVQLTTEQLYLCKGMFYEILNAFEILFGGANAGAAGAAGAGAGAGAGVAATAESTHAPHALNSTATTVSLLFRHKAPDSVPPPMAGPKWFRNKYLMRVICATLGFVWCPPGEELLEAQESSTHNFHLAGDPHSILRMKAVYEHLGWHYPEEVLSKTLGNAE
jgi:hypothetical protein